MFFGKLVKIVNGHYKVAGGIRIQNNSKYDSMIKVTQDSDTFVQCKFTTYETLPKVILTYMNYNRPLAHEINIFIKWVYHENIDVRIALFGSNAHVEKNDQLREFMNTARFVHRSNNISHTHVFKFAASLEVVYFSVDEYDRGFLNEEDDDHVIHHHDLNSFKAVIYLKPTNTTTTIHDTIKIIPIHVD